VIKGRGGVLRNRVGNFFAHLIHPVGKAERKFFGNLKRWGVERKRDLSLGGGNLHEVRGDLLEWKGFLFLKKY